MKMKILQFNARRKDPRPDRAVAYVQSTTPGKLQTNIWDTFLCADAKA